MLGSRKSFGVDLELVFSNDVSRPSSLLLERRNMSRTRVMLNMMRRTLLLLRPKNEKSCHPT